MVLRFRGGTPTDIAYVGQDWLPAWAAAGFLAPLDDIAPADVLADLKSDMARLRAERHDLQGQALRPALLRRHDLLHLQQEDPRGRRHRRADDLGRGDGGGREAEGRRHGASDRLRVRSGAPELLRRLRRAGPTAAAATSSTRTSKAIFDNPEQRRLQAARMAGGRLQEGPRAAGDARVEGHPVDEHRQARLHRSLYNYVLAAHEQRRRAAARRPVRAGSDAGRGARDARLHEVLLDHGARPPPIRRAPKRRGSS